MAAMFHTKCILSHTSTGAGDSSPVPAERQPGSEPPQEASTSGRSEADSTGAPAQIGIIMGSDSDLKTMAAAEEVRACLTQDMSLSMAPAQGLLMTEGILG